jgi:hypothetical protein
VKVDEAAKKAAPPRLEQEDAVLGDCRTISMPRTRIHTLEELIEICEIDLEVWEVERFICNKWEVGIKVGAAENATVEVEPLFQVKAFLKRRPRIDEAKHIIERLWKRAESHVPACYVHKKKASTKSGNIVEHAIADIHHGAQIWGRETGSADWDLKKSIKVHKEAFQTLIWRTDGYDPEAALLVLGNDRQNADNRRGQTEAGTQQDNDSRYQKIFDASCDLAIWEIDICLDRYGRVIVKIVPGNHDPLASWHLGKALSFQYGKESRVEIDNSPNPKKYWEYGTNMVLFTHGQNRPKGKLENFGKIMAAERPSMWGRTRWRECHTGHVHHKQAFEVEGAIVRSLSSLRPACAWSNEMNFTGSIRAAESFVWSKTLGMIGTAVFSLLDKRVE